MITLVALRIGSEYGILQNHLLQFDPRFQISIVESNGNIEINIQRKADHIGNFFGDHLSSITALVGKNGVGKSTLLRYLKDMFINERSELRNRDNDIIVIQEDSVIKIFIPELYRSRITMQEVQGFSQELHYYRGYPKIFDKIKNLTTVFYSSAIDIDQPEQETINFFNISTGFLMENIGKINSKLKNRMIRSQNAHARFRFTELKRQINFMRELMEKPDILNIPFRRIGELQLKIKPLSAAEYGKFTQDLEVIYLGSKLDRLKEVDMNTLKPRLFFDWAESAVNNIQQFFVSLKRNTPADSHLGTIQLNLSENLSFLFLRLSLADCSELLLGEFSPQMTAEIQGVVKEMTLELSGSGKISSTVRRLIGLFQNQLQASVVNNKVQTSIEKIIRSMEEIISFEAFMIEFLSFGKAGNNSMYFETGDPRIEDMLNRYYGTSINMRFIKFDWPKLSAGEEALISFFSRLHVVAKDSRKENLLLLIDEGDLYFHPEWQRQYIFYLLNYLKSGFVDFRHIQVILTTHSPFIIADLPNENIIFMNREGNEVKLVDPKEQSIETFGGNIHALYARAFFMGDSTTSEFAFQKIKQDILIPLAGKDNCINEPVMKKLIDGVGEPVLRLALHDRLKRRLDGSNT